MLNGTLTAIYLTCLLAFSPPDVIAAKPDSKHECKNKIDDDGDGFIDRSDVGCYRGGKSETNCGDNVCGEGETSCPADCGPAITPVSYLYDYQVIDGIPDPVRVRGVGFVPNAPNPPIVFINTLNASRCVADDPATIPFTVTDNEYDCPEGYSEVELAEGMLYLAERLAENGYLAIAIDSNQLMWNFHALYTFSEVVTYRVALVLEHLRLWEGIADTSRLSLVGHSLGGLVVYELAKLIEVDSVYLIAPALGLDSQSMESRFGLLLAGCDEDTQQHRLPSIAIFDKAIRARSFEMEQVYIKKGNHARFNSNALPVGSGCIGGYENLLPPEEQRAITADVVSRFVTGEYSERPASSSYFDASPDPIELQYQGFTEVLNCGPQCEDWDFNNPSPVYYYKHDIEAVRLSWDGPATIFPPNGVTDWSLRITYSIDDPRNVDGVVVNGEQLPKPISDTEYSPPCELRSSGWICFEWWMAPREILHTLEANGPITLDGAGRIIIANAERG